MFRKINKDKSISKIVVYSIILTWFAVILVENWQYMRVTWFKEVWDFIDFKAIGHYIDNNLAIWVFAAGFIIVPCAILSLCNKSNKTSLTSFEECQNDWEEQQAASQRSNPVYDYMPCNVSFRTEFEKEHKSK